MTEWRAVPGWEGYYEVGDDGQVRSLPRSLPRVNGRPLNLRGRVLKPTPNRDGYLSVGLCRDDRKATLRVHRLVLLAWAGPCPDGMEACHNDGNPRNNQASNLRWDTRSANTYDRIKHGTHFAARKTHCKHGHPFDEINTYRTRDGKRHCKACQSDRKRVYADRRRAA